uniref:ANK_REP_REGION domain-containing protein n=1 Tax=Macrostomum lignano TaxID=282301 RepID=A0A1I8GLG5_9PLAT
DKGKDALGLYWWRLTTSLGRHQQHRQHFVDAGQPAGVNLADVQRCGLEELLEQNFVLAHLSGCYAHPERLQGIAYSPMAQHIVRAGWLLDPVGLELGQLAHPGDGLRHRPALVGVLPRPNVKAEPQPLSPASLVVSSTYAAEYSAGQMAFVEIDSIRVDPLSGTLYLLLLLPLQLVLTANPSFPRLRGTRINISKTGNPSDQAVPTVSASAFRIVVDGNDRIRTSADRSSTPPAAELLDVVWAAASEAKLSSPLQPALKQRRQTAGPAGPTGACAAAFSRGRIARSRPDSQPRRIVLKAVVAAAVAGAKKPAVGAVLARLLVAVDEADVAVPLLHGDGRLQQAGPGAEAEAQAKADRKSARSWRFSRSGQRRQRASIGHDWLQLLGRLDIDASRLFQFIAIGISFIVNAASIVFGALLIVTASTATTSGRRNKFGVSSLTHVLAVQAFDFSTITIAVVSPSDQAATESSGVAAAADCGYDSSAKGAHDDAVDNWIGAGVQGHQEHANQLRGRVVHVLHQVQVPEQMPVITTADLVSSVAARRRKRLAAAAERRLPRPLRRQTIPTYRQTTPVDEAEPGEAVHLEYAFPDGIGDLAAAQVAARVELYGEHVNNVYEERAGGCRSPAERLVPDRAEHGPVAIDGNQQQVLDAGEHRVPVEQLAVQHVTEHKAEAAAVRGILIWLQDDHQSEGAHEQRRRASVATTNEFPARPRVAMTTWVQRRPAAHQAAAAAAAASAALSVAVALPRPPAVVVDKSLISADTSDFDSSGMVSRGARTGGSGRGLSFSGAANLKQSISKWKTVTRERRHVHDIPHKSIQLEDEKACPVSPLLAIDDHNGRTRLFGRDLIDNGVTPDQKALNKRLLVYFVRISTPDSDLHSNELDTDFIMDLIAQGADLNAKDRYGQTVLHEVAANWSPSVMDLMIECGGNPNAADYLGWTPLHVAAASNYPEMCRVLVRRRADKEAKSSNDQTPLFFAAKTDSARSLRALIKLGCKMEVRDKRNRTPLFAASELDRSATSAVLLEHGADAFSQDSSGQIAFVPLLQKMPPLAKAALEQLYETFRIERVQRLDLFRLDPIIIRDSSKGEEPKEGSISPTQLDELPYVSAVLLQLATIILWTVFAVMKEWTQRYEYQLPEEWYRILILVLAILLTLYNIGDEIHEYLQSKKRHERWKKWRLEQIDEDRKHCHAKHSEELDYWLGERAIVVKSNVSYFSDFWNYLDWMCYLLLVASIVSHFVDVGYPGGEGNLIVARWHVRIMAANIVLLWVRLLKYAKPFEFFGPFIVMLGMIAGDLLKFFLLYLEFLIPFACVFWTILGGEKNNLKEADVLQSGTLKNYTAHNFTKVTVKNFGKVNELLFSVFRITLVDDYDY